MAVCVHEAGILYHRYLDIIWDPQLSYYGLLSIYSTMATNILATLLFVLFLTRNSHILNYYDNKVSIEKDPVTGKTDLKCREVMSKPYWVLFVTVSFSLILFSFSVSMLSNR